MAHFSQIILLQLLIEGLRMTFLDDLFLSSYFIIPLATLPLQPILIPRPSFSPQGDNFRFGSIPERPSAPPPFIVNQSE